MLSIDRNASGSARSRCSVNNRTGSILGVAVIVMISFKATAEGLLKDHAVAVSYILTTRSSPRTPYTTSLDSTASLSLPSSSMTDRDALLAHINTRAVVVGEVTLSSGRTADYYVDLRRITLSGTAAPLVGRVMLEVSAELDYDAVGGLTMGADPVAAAMLHAAGATGHVLDAFVVRKEGKAYGLQRLIEGPGVAGRRVLAVDDTSTTGGSVLAAVESLRAAGADVVGVAVIVDRDTGARENVEAAGLRYLCAYGVNDLRVP